MYNYFDCTNFNEKKIKTSIVLLKNNFIGNLKKKIGLTEFDPKIF